MFIQPRVSPQRAAPAACLQAAAAVEYMHAHDVIHLDLTSANLLVADGWIAKVRRRAGYKV